MVGGNKRSTRLGAHVAAVLVTTTALGAPVEAAAEDTAYCRKVQERAASDASLLFAPTVQADVIRFPRSGTVDAGVTTGVDVQVRAGVSLSPLDVYKGVRVLRVGDADCKHHEAAVRAQDVLASGVDVARLPALRKKLALLDARRAVWEAAVTRSEERLGAHVTSLLDVHEVRARASELERRRSAAAGDVARLEARGIAGSREALSTLVGTSEARAMELEREVSHVRSLDAWQVRLTGGVVPNDSPVDYFAVVHVGFNVGGLFRNAHERRYLEARGEELRHAQYETREQVRRFREVVKATAAEARRALEVVRRDEASLAASRVALESADAPNAAHALSIVELELVIAESERVFLSALVEELSQMEVGRDER